MTPGPTLRVNGRFYAARPSGVQRVADALVRGLCDRAEVTLQVPRGCPVPGEVARRARVRAGRLGGQAWEQLELPLRRGGGVVAVDPANAGPAWGGRRVLVLHDVLPLSHPAAYAPGFRRWFGQVVARAARRARVVVMFSEWAREEAIRRIGLPPDRVRVIPQGIEPFHEPAPPDLVRRTLERFQIHGPFILAAGGGDPRKNAGFLGEVLERLPPGPDGPVPLVLVGAGYSHVHAAAPLPGASKRIRPVGHVTDDELRALYTAARVFCFPSLAEGFGRPPLEAMGCGTPVVAAAYEAGAEVLGDAAIRLPLDAAAWCGAVSDLLSDDALHASRRAAGLRHARAFRWDAAADALLLACADAAEGA